MPLRAAWILVVDNCSNFDIHEEMARYGGAVRGVRSAYNGGCGYARNFGIPLTTGEFIAFLDDDDVWLDTHIRQHVSLFDADPELDLLLGVAARVGGDRRRGGGSKQQGREQGSEAHACRPMDWFAHYSHSVARGASALPCNG